MAPQSKKHLLVGSFLLIGLVAFLGWKAAYGAEPVYQGRPLTSWVEQWVTNHSDFGPPTDERKNANREAELAIHQIGPTGIPFLLGLMGNEEPAAKKWIRALAPDFLISQLHQEAKVADFKRLGAYGLVALGTNAGQAVPELMRLISVEMDRNPYDPTTGYLPVLVLGYLGNAAAPAVPLLTQCLTNQNPALQSYAAHRLGQIHRQPELVVPALLAFLEASPRAWIQPQCNAIQSLGMFGTNAFAAAPTLVTLLDDPNPDIRRAVTNWLPAIDRAAAERAGIPLPWER